MDESDISGLEQTLMETKETGNIYLQAAFTKFLFRWVSLILLYLIFTPLFPCLKWALLILVPLFLYSFYQIYTQKKQFAEKIKELQLLIESIKNLDTK